MLPSCFVSDSNNPVLRLTVHIILYCSGCLFVAVIESIKASLLIASFDDLWMLAVIGFGAL